MTSISFHGGVNEVGGNKILLEDKGTKIFIDFGKGFSAWEKYFEDYLKPRSANGILDFIEMDQIPDIPGIYREDLIEKAGRKSDDPDIDAVIVSHAHADHVDYISFLHKDIPLYMGQTTHNMLKAIQERSVDSFDRQILEFKEVNGRRGEKVQRKVKEFRSGKKFKIGSVASYHSLINLKIPLIFIIPLT